MSSTRMRMRFGGCSGPGFRVFSGVAAVTFATFKKSVAREPGVLHSAQAPVVFGSGVAFSARKKCAARAAAATSSRAKVFIWEDEVCEESFRKTELYPLLDRGQASPRAGCVSRVRAIQLIAQ